MRLIYFSYFLLAIFGVVLSTRLLVDDDFLKALTNIQLLDWLTILFLPFFLLTLLLHTWRSKRLLSQRELYTIFMTIVVFSLGVFIIFFIPENRSSGPIIYCGVLATLGWLYSNVISVHNGRKAHTMTVLLQMRLSSEMRQHRANVFSRYPYSLARIPADHLPELKRERASPENFIAPKIPILESIYFIINYYEFIAAGVELDDLDETLIKNTIRGILVENYSFYEEIIMDARKSSDGRINEKVYQHFTNLVNRYKEPQIIRRAVKSPLPRTSRAAGRR